MLQSYGLVLGFVITFCSFIIVVFLECRKLIKYHKDIKRFYNKDKDKERGF